MLVCGDGTRRVPALLFPAHLSELRQVRPGMCRSRGEGVHPAKIFWPSCAGAGLTGGQRACGAWHTPFPLSGRFILTSLLLLVLPRTRGSNACGRPALCGGDAVAVFCCSAGPRA